VVLLRADMDGLPVEEKSGLANASTVRQVGVDGVEAPVMHACGHDTHITAMVATARRLAAPGIAGGHGGLHRPARRGTRRRGEGDGGGRGSSRFPKPDYAVAFHVDAERAAGTVSASEGIQYSSSDSVDITVPGIGAHGASPHMGKDPVYMASQLVVALQG
jgi:hippurate hydrolase